MGDATSIRYDHGVRTCRDITDPDEMTVTDPVAGNTLLAAAMQLLADHDIL